MAARWLLLKLERRGLLRLFPRQRPGRANHKARRIALEPELALDLISRVGLRSALAPLRPLRVTLVGDAQGRRDFTRLLQQHHYLGYSRPVGENLPSLVESRCGRPLACALFGAAAWKCAPRDRFIGWGAQARQEHLQSNAKNARLLILPWVRPRAGAAKDPTLASAPLPSRLFIFGRCILASASSCMGQPLRSGGPTNRK